MNLRKRVIESTIIAVMLTVVTAVTAVMQTAPVENVPEPQQETKAVADVQTDGSAGIIEELASLGDAATEQASIERADVVVVAEAQEEEPQLSEEQQAWNSKLMADVDDFLYIRSSADGESEVIGKLYKGAAADIVETLDGWYHITSGSVDGYVKSEEPFNFWVKTDKNQTQPNSKPDGFNGTAVEVGGTLLAANDVAVTPDYTLPETGGSGTLNYILAGLLLMAAATMLLYKQKQRGREEL